MRLLHDFERERLKIFTQNKISFTLIEPTATGLKKSILDATIPVRNFLKTQTIHDYQLQDQGTEHKVLKQAVLVTPSRSIESLASLYRPNTKKGDPRIWFRKLKKYAKPNDIIALINFDDRLWVINITQLPIDELFNTSQPNFIQDLLQSISQKENAIANELLEKLRIIAQQGFIPAQVQADTAVGRTLERVLGIAMNSAKTPDYKGIELKSFRDRRQNRKNLFTQVANWKLSKFKSSAEILDNFGYWRAEDFKLYCTVSTKKPNSQGLFLSVNHDLGHLIETSVQDDIGDFAVWLLEKLHQRLLTKHRETFWIAAESKFEHNRELFRYYQVEHTQKPIIQQFDLLLEQGFITLDHLIKRSASGKVVEKGPIFKISKNALELLFPPSQTYDLLLS